MTDKTGWQPEQGLEQEAARPFDQEDATGGDRAASSSSPSASEEDLSTIEVVRLLIAEGRDYAAHEVQRQKLRAAILGKAARDAAILGIVALFLLMGALIAGLIGLIMALAPLVGGSLAATGIVIGATLLLILILLLIARARVKRAVRQSFHQEAVGKGIVE